MSFFYLKKNNADQEENYLVKEEEALMVEAEEKCGRG
jgi:hypothetical protein